MKKEIFYSILKYKHGLILGESLNAGILFYDPALNSFSFEIGDIKRLANAYPDINYNYLKRFFSTVKENLKRFENSSLSYFEIGSLKEFISKDIFFSDAAGLTFDAVEKIPVSQSNDVKKTILYLKELYLVGQIETERVPRKRNEDFILSQINGILKSKDSEISKRIEKDKKISTPLIQFTFDVFWRAKSDHLVKALAFDLENGILIQNKALQIYGALEQLNLQLNDTNNSSTFDLLITKPGNKNHFKEFENALKIIDSINAPKTIFLEDDWKSYANQILSKAEELTSI
ncbi:hypothetical protein [Algoriphagus formosus]|uniref:hypothetical protein n=1 Tax=Algoriphagus formosus TaxID=2007308 RepID=UPI003F6FF898